jgi:hypothetical protein
VRSSPLATPTTLTTPTPTTPSCHHDKYPSCAFFWPQSAHVLTALHSSPKRRVDTDVMKL